MPNKDYEKYVLPWRKKVKFSDKNKKCLFLVYLSHMFFNPVSPLMILPKKFSIYVN